MNSHRFSDGTGSQSPFLRAWKRAPIRPLARPMDPVRNSHTVIGIARHSQIGNSADRGFDPGDKVFVTHVVLRHRAQASAAMLK